MEQQQIDQSLRLKKLIKALNVNQSELAKTLGMAQPNISRILNGGAQVSIELVNKISNVYKQVNLHWLLTGDGEMLFEKNPQVDELLPNIIEGKGTLEERMERLEDVVRGLVKSFEK